MARPSNREIVRLLQTGDRLGCRLLMDHYQDRLLSDAVEIFGLSVEDADEVVSDVLLAVVEKIGSFSFKKSDGDFHFWVTAIFRNRVRDCVRRRTLEEGVRGVFDESNMDAESGYAAPEWEVIREIVRAYEETVRSESGGEEDRCAGRGRKLEAIAETLERMETWERVLLRCRALDVPYEMIAGYTGKTANQLKVYHARVKKKFVRLLVQHYPELKPHET